MQVFLDFMGQMQLVRKREEEERAQQRTFDPMGFLGGGLLGAFPTRKQKKELSGFGRVARGVGAIAPITGMVIGGAAGGPLGAALGSTIGQTASQQLPGGVGGDPATMLAEGFRPALQTMLTQSQVGRRQADYLTLRDAQIGRRQQEQSIRQETVARRQKDQQFQQMPPHLQAEITTAQHNIDEARFAYQMGEYGRPGSPGAQDAFSQAITPHSVRIEEARKWEPPPPPTTQQQYESGTGPYFDDKTRAWIIPKGYTVKPDKPAYTPLERQEMLEMKTKEFTLQFEEEEIARSQQNIMQSGTAKSAEEAGKMAKKLFDSVQANARIVNERAQQAAEQYVERFMPASRMPHLQPTTDEKQQQQEAAKQQQEVAEQQQQAQQQQVQEQQLEQAQAMFQASGQTLTGIQQEWGTDPSKWSKGKVEAARPAAEAFIQAATVLVPAMPPEQAIPLRPLIELATAILMRPRTLSVPEELPGESK
jgi:hypothetical protein